MNVQMTEKEKQLEIEK